MFRVWRPRDGDGGRGEGAFQFERLYVKVTPWRLVLLATGVGAYLAGLLVFLPAEAALGDERDVVGTVWKGEAALEPGFAAGWSTRPFSSLVSLSGVADVAVRGPDTDIMGDVSMRPNGPVIRRMEGAGSTRLLNALAPALPFVCDGDLQVSAANLALRGGMSGEGRLQSGAATCAAKAGGPAWPTPSLSASLSSGADGSAMTAMGPDGAPIATARRTRDGAVALSVLPGAAALLPGVTPLTLETRL